MDKRQSYRGLISIVLFSCILSTSLIGQKGVNSTVVMTKARHEFLKNNFWGALDEYRKIYDRNINDPKLIYRMGECHLALKHYKIARSFFEEVEELDPDVNKELAYLLGKTYHSLEELDKAIEHYKMFKRSIPDGQDEYYELSKRIKQCVYAKEMMINPVNVEIENLGTGINSRFDDYAPSISADGKLLVFTARRSSMTKGEVDVRGDFKYFEDIYYSIWNEETKSWETAEELSETINTDAHDAVLSLTPDGQGIFVYKNNEKSAGDIFYSYRTGEHTWSQCEKLPKPINTTYFESSVSLTEDGNTMYFISERPSGMGRGDIFVSTKINELSWGKPKNIGAPINTKGDEKFVFIHPKGNILFFASEGQKTMGSYDIFRCVREGTKWSKPVNLGYPINTVNEESTFSMTRDNKKLLISAEYEGGQGERDIYEIDLSNFDIIEGLKINEETLEESSVTRVFGVIKGKNSDNVIKNERLIFLDNKTKDIVFETTTNEFGEFEVNLPKGKSFYMLMDVKGFEKYEKRLSLKSELADLIEFERNIELRQKN